MLPVKKPFRFIVLFCSLASIFLFNHMRAEETQKKAPFDQQKGEGTQFKGSAQNQPKLTLDSIKYDAGEVYEGSVIVHDFIVKNTGKAQLNIEKVKAGWGCTVASFDKAISPGQEGKVTLKVDTKNKRSRLKQSATIISNDPQNPQTKITITGSIKQCISVEPSSRIMLNGYAGDKISKQVTISSHEETPFEVINITSTIDDKIKYKLKTKEKGKEYVLEIKNRSTKEGTFRGKIVMTTDSKKKPRVTLSVLSRLQQEVMVKPASLSFGTIDTASENFDAEKLSKEVTLRDIRGDGLVIKKVKSSSDWITTEHIKKSKWYTTIIITLDKDKLPKGEFEEKIDIRTNYKKKSLIVGIKGRVI